MLPAHKKMFMFKSNFIDIFYDDLFVVSGTKSGIGASSSICVILITAILKILNMEITQRLDLVNK